MAHGAFASATCMLHLTGKTPRLLKVGFSSTLIFGIHFFSFFVFFVLLSASAVESAML
jgi:hypothetical protein